MVGPFVGKWTIFGPTIQGKTDHYRTIFGPFFSYWSDQKDPFFCCAWRKVAVKTALEKGLNIPNHTCCYKFFRNQIFERTLLIFVCGVLFIQFSFLCFCSPEV
jgi:hypothetical protein